MLAEAGCLAFPPEDQVGNTVSDAKPVDLAPGQTFQLNERMSNPSGFDFHWLPANGDTSYPCVDLWDNRVIIDRDLYAVTLVAGQSMDVDIDARFSDFVCGETQFSGADSFLRVFDSAGNVVATNDDGRDSDEPSVVTDDSFLTFVAPTSGLYIHTLRPNPRWECQYARCGRIITAPISGPIASLVIDIHPFIKRICARADRNIELQLTTFLGRSVTN